MFETFIIYFLLFMIYSIIGYLVEVICVSFADKKLTTSRGFLIGPYLPIYGTGTLIMTCFLSKYKNDVLALFIMSTILCTILEYMTSYVLEKIFKLRWWDYSEQSFNINGRVCLSNGVLFGFGGVIVVELVNPILKELLYNIPTWLIISLGVFLLAVFIIDLTISMYIMTRLKINVSKYTKKDASNIIRKEVQEVLKKNTYLTNRLFKSFPHIKSLNNKDFRSFQELFYKTRQEVQRLKQEYKQKKNK